MFRGINDEWEQTFDGRKFDDEEDDDDVVVASRMMLVSGC